MKTEYKNDITMDPSDFVVLADYVPHIVQEIRYYSTYNFIGERIDGYEEPCALLTKEAARALKSVSNEMIVQGYRLKVFDAYRPARAVKHFVLWGIEDTDIRMKPYFYPDLEKQELFAQGYIAKQSSHSRGSTVDLTLLDMQTGKELDMGGPFDYFSELSHPDYKGITEEQYDNRMILQRVMIRNGFKPIDCEWWHFTLENEPYPDTYFDFPVSSEYLRR
ncbi:MAG: M15 family metallopeptidase [Lachnospiraceae bacterium]|nr:M15 family metallopeptidase [Lachnospiraceae bacterium]